MRPGLLGTPSPSSTQPQSLSFVLAFSMPLSVGILCVFLLRNLVGFWAALCCCPTGLGVQSQSPFVTRKSGHIWRIWAEMTQTLMPKSSKVAQIHLPECHSAKIRQSSAKIPPNFVSQKSSDFEHPTEGFGDRSP